MRIVKIIHCIVYADFMKRGKNFTQIENILDESVCAKKNDQGELKFEYKAK